MNTFWKVALGFIGGVICAIGALFIIGLAFSSRQSPEDLIQERRDELKLTNLQYFELSTPKGDITLHTYMPKDSVKMLMGKPTSVDVSNLGVVGVHETWEYKGSNRYINEFTLEFVNGELESVSQYQE